MSTALSIIALAVGVFVLGTLFGAVIMATHMIWLSNKALALAYQRGVSHGRKHQALP